MQKKRKTIPKKIREQVYNKYQGHCAYCGKEIEYKDFQLDHLLPVANWGGKYTEEEIECFDNYMPACRRCNHYKRGYSLEKFRKMIQEIPNKLYRDNYIYKVGLDYNLIKSEESPKVQFYFEKFSPFTIGLTGPTGAGKSYICNKLEKEGFTIISADKIAREVLEKPEIQQQLQSTFGPEIITTEGVNRKYLANLVFNSTEELEKLNTITHPVIIKQAICEAQGHDLTVFDAPQLFESGADKDCKFIVAIIASEKTRLARIMSRDNLTAEEAENRMASQYPSSFFMDMADFIIFNSEGASEEDLDIKVKKLAQLCK